ncbi:MAG: hypothetical protein CMM58_10615 [Rhodospirillaceae bacterium]|nr:hypothetical protein [Rhodospirillaceae bacterium]|tara:strand:+ start:590 stop:886 length:297 start_codon:yes stop_codon:yes gene_type:complete
MGQYLDDLWNDLEQTWDLAMKVNDLAEEERNDPAKAWDNHFKGASLVDVARTESEISGDGQIAKVYCTNIYGLQYNPETKYWVPFRHGEVDLVKFTED